MTDTQTIAAIATAPGVGGIGIIRLSGPNSHLALTRLFVPASPRFTDFVPWKLHRGRLVDAAGRTLDDVLAVLMPGPGSYTGEDVAELHCHGGPALLAAILEQTLRFARLAERGEFSRRAFMNGRMDLSQAEAVAELISAPSKEGAVLAAGKLEGLLGRRVRALRETLERLRAQLCLAVDFPDDEIEPLPRAVFLANIVGVEQGVQALLAGVERTRCWREGIVVTLAGPVNTGKSSLMNALLGRERAIVTPLPGTTRDFLEEAVSFAGLPARLVDTAGLRAAAETGPVEAAGIDMGLARLRVADVALVLIDGTRGLVPETRELLRGIAAARLLLVWNKADLVPAPEAFVRGTGVWAMPCAGRAVLSARTGEGVEALAALVRATALAGLGAGEPDPDEAAPNARQAGELGAALEALSALRVDAAAGFPYELCFVRLEEAARALGSVTGLDTSDDVLNRIFDTFCIGK